MHNFCTLFDSHYLTRGVALYESLLENCPEFHLYIYAFDDVSFEILGSLNLSHATIVSLGELEDEALLEVKSTRSVGEYCWTCTPSIIKHAIETYQLPACTYLDADIYFFSDPASLIDELGDGSILITEHRYTSEYNQTKNSGIYCVQFTTFKNDTSGMSALNWWREACIEWCYNRVEDGKFGDQKYLDDWPVRFEGVHVLQHLGGGVAPWNVQQYDLSDPRFEVVFYHFHGLKFIQNQMVNLGKYKYTPAVLSRVYQPYISHIERINSQLLAISPVFSQNLSVVNDEIISPLRRFTRFLKGHHHVYKKSKFLCQN
jgi:hypothetical protein